AGLQACLCGALRLCRGLLKLIENLPLTLEVLEVGMLGVPPGLPLPNFHNVFGDMSVNGLSH
ncbi:MAG: hypothetical protein V4623_11155, partial [Pseudomonadota bacterium]